VTPRHARPPGPSWTIALGFGVVFLLVLLAGADKPPSQGFLWLVGLDIALVLVVRWRLRSWWSTAAETGLVRWFARGAAEGALTGLLVAVPFALRGSGEPTLDISPTSYAVWFAVMVLVGVGVGLLVATAARIWCPGRDR